MKLNKKNIWNKVKEIIEAENFLLIDILFRGDNNNRIIEIFIDNESGVLIDDCAKLNKAISAYLENENLINSNYRIDVSSPGINRPLKFIRQYPKHIGREFHISYYLNDQLKTFNAKLVGVNKNILTFESKKKIQNIEFDSIKSAKVLMNF